MRHAMLALAALGLLSLGAKPVVAIESVPAPAAPHLNVAVDDAVFVPVKRPVYRYSPSYRYYNHPPYRAYYPRYHGYVPPRYNTYYYGVPRGGYYYYSPYGFGFEYHGPRRSFGFGF